MERVLANILLPRQVGLGQLVVDEAGNTTLEEHGHYKVASEMYPVSSHKLSNPS